MRLTYFSPTSGYTSLDLYRNGCPACDIHNGVHPFDHGLLHLGLCPRPLPCVALDDYLVMADEYRHGSRTFASSLPQKRQCQLQAVGCGSLDRGVEAVGQPLDAHPAPAGERPGLGMAA